MLSEVKELHKNSHGHWHYVRKRRTVIAKVNANQIIAAQIFTVVVSIVGGMVLESYKIQVAAFAGALVLYPGVIDLIASVAGALGAKVNHHLETTSYKKRSILINDTLFALVVSGLASVVLGLAAFLLGSILSDVSAKDIIMLSVLTVLSVGFVLYPLLSLLVVAFRKLKLNPDNLIGPIESSVVDVVATIAFVLIISNIL